jgi:outer membrane protein OmpA-like peptidoglycan-associated protein
MKKFIGFIIIVLIGLCIFAWVKWGSPYFAEKKQLKNSGVNASNMETFTWGGDGYGGYYVLKSTELRRRLALKGIILKFVDDGGAYADRLEKFSKGEYDFIVLPISSFIQHGKKYSYNIGTIPAPISNSIGADDLLAFPEFKFSKVNDLDNPNIKIIYTGASPTEDIINLTISTFDLSNLQESSSWKINVGSSEEVFDLAKKAAKDNNVDKSNTLYGMWEPEVSKAEELGMKRIWGSENFSNYIIDIFVFSNKSMSVHADKVTEILRTYYEVVDYYNAHQDEQVKELKKLTGLKQEAVEKLRKGIHWYSLYESAHEMLGIPINAGDQANEGLVRTIYAWNDINSLMKLEGEVDNPYTIINKKILENLLASSLKPVSSSAKSTLPTNFSPLDEKGWESLTETGIMKVENITFQSSVNEVDDLGEEVIAKVSEKLLHNYPNYRFLVAGHTGGGENEKANIKLSQERADAVRQILIAVWNIDPNRILAKGFGSSRPPQRKANESDRAYRSRMARVEFILMQ